MNIKPFAPIRKLVTVLVMLFLLEAAVMAMINLLQLPVSLEAVIDASTLIVLAIPVLYLQFIRPMIHQYQVAVEARKTAEALRSASVELAQTLDLNGVMDILLRQVRELVPVDFAALYLLQPPYWLVPRAVRGCEDDGDGDESAVSTGFDVRNNPILHRILTEQKSIAVQDVSVLEGWAWCPEAVASKSWIGAPLVSGGKVIGLCGFGHGQPDQFVQERFHLVEGLVSQAAAAIQNASLFDQVQSARGRLQTLTHKIVELQENERRSIARDLYDEVGQEVVAVLYQLRLLDQKVNQPEALLARIADLDRDLSSVLENLHNLAVNLRPASLDHLGLGAAIQQDLEAICEKHNLQYHCKVTGLSGRLPEVIETVLYRIAQETLANVVEHARATQVDVTLRRHDDQLVFSVQDNGIGFNPSAVDQARSFGLLGIHERAEMIGGEVSIDSSPGKGTSVFISLPVPERA